MFKLARRFALLSGALFLLSGATCPPKTPPPKLPPKDVPRLQKLGDTTGQRAGVIEEAVQIGSNQARVIYDCGPPHGKNVVGRGILSPPVTRCEIDTATKIVTLGEVAVECPAFLMTLNDYHGPGTYNTASLGQVSFGAANLKQPACGWEANLCLDWNRTANVHPETQCTIEVNSDGGLQYGTAGATISGTFVCTSFMSAWKGCAGVSAVAGCAVTRGSFSVAGCQAQSSPSSAKKPEPPKPGPKGKRSK